MMLPMYFFSLNGVVVVGPSRNWSDYDGNKKSRADLIWDWNGIVRYILSEAIRLDHVHG